LQAKQGEFGCFLQLAHNWADFDNTKKSFELWQRHVTPVINKANVNRVDSYNDAGANSEKYIGAAMGAAMATIQKHAIEQAQKDKKSAAE
jgi:limonene 1,2-monooxygenase